MSDPVSPSPRSFEFPLISEGASDTPPDALPGILKKPKAEGRPVKAKSKRVTIEEVPDEEDDDLPRLETLTPDSRYILEIVEPMPSVPSNTFSSILKFDDAKSHPPPSHANASSIPPDRRGSEKESNNDASQRDASLGGASDVMNDKAKHVRWTPSVLSNRTPSPEASLLAADELLSALTGYDGADQALPPKSRSRTNSLVQMLGRDLASEAERREKGKERSFGQDASEEIDWYTTGAFDPSRRVRSNPASAM